METERFLISLQINVRHRKKRNSYVQVDIAQILPGITTRTFSMGSAEGWGRGPATVFLWVPEGQTTHTGTQGEPTNILHQQVRGGHHTTHLNPDKLLLSPPPAPRLCLFWLLPSLSEFLKQGSFVFLHWMLIPLSRSSEEGGGCSMHIFLLSSLHKQVCKPAHVHGQGEEQKQAKHCWD